MKYQKKSDSTDSIFVTAVTLVGIITGVLFAFSVQEWPDYLFSAEGLLYVGLCMVGGKIGGFLLGFPVAITIKLLEDS